jgi:hypothetical protein
MGGVKEIRGDVDDELLRMDGGRLGTGYWKTGLVHKTWRSALSYTYPCFAWCKSMQSARQRHAISRVSSGKHAPVSRW